MSVKAQPPPRKVKLSNHLKTLHSEQLTKLYLKHQQDTELLDDIRNFAKIRAQIEKDCGTAMVKLATTYLAKKPPSGIDYKTEDKVDIRSVFGVWRMLLDESEKIGKARLASADVFQSRISENAKNTRQAKLHVAKRCFDALRKYQEEVQQTVLEVDKTRKLYFEEEHMAHDARGKAHDVEEKLKKKKGGIFSSISSLQKKNDKFSSRREACDIQSTKARNDYILALAAANAHQTRYYETDLRDILENLDCDVSEKVREYLVIMSRTELLTVAACNSSFTRIQEEASKITKQYSTDQYLTDNAILGQKIDYEFDACDGDEICIICTDHLAEHALQKDAKRWASAYMKECRVLRDSNRELTKLLNKRDKGEKTIENVSGECEDIDWKIDEYKNIIRRAETGLVKAEARLNALRAGAVNVDGYLSSLDMDSLQIEELTRKSSRASQRSSDAREAEERTDSQSSEAVEDVPRRDPCDEDAQPDNRNSSQSCEDYEEQDYDHEDYQEYDHAEPQTSYDDPTAVDWGDTEIPAAEQPQSYEASSIEYSSGAWNQQEEAQDSGDWNVTKLKAGCRCIAIYTYEAANDDELSFAENEELECVHEGDGDGWIRARNAQKQEGYIPANYVQISENQVGEPPTTDESFGAVAYNKVPAAAPPSSLPESLAPTTQQQEESYCRALYDYESTCEDELTFLEGDVIRIVSKLGSDGVDDGWWTGEFSGNIGKFPSLVVEELKHTGEHPIPITPTIQTPDGLPPPPNFEPPKPIQTPNEESPEVPLGTVEESGPSSGSTPLPPVPEPASAVNIVIDSPDEPPREFFDSFDEEEPPTTIERKPPATTDQGENHQTEEKEQQKKDEDEKEQAEDEKKDEEKTSEGKDSPGGTDPIELPQPPSEKTGSAVAVDNNFGENDDDEGSLSSPPSMPPPPAPLADSPQEVPVETAQDLPALPIYLSSPPPPAPEVDSPTEGDLC